MSEIMSSLRENHPTEIGGYKVIEFADYLNSVSVDLITGEKTEITLPKSNVLVFGLEDNEGVIIRPSGTEPKIKAYYTAVASTQAEAEKIESKLVESLSALIK